MQEVKIDYAAAETLQAALACLGQFCTRGIMGIHLCHDKYTLALTFDRIGHNLFCAAFAVHFCGIDQAHAEINAQTQRRHFVRVCAFLFAHAPGALTQHGHALTIR